MTEPNGDGRKTMERFYAAEAKFMAEGASDFSEVAAMLDAECALFEPESLPYGGEWRGVAGVEAWMKQFSAIWRTLEVREPEMHVLGDLVVSRSHVYAVTRATGRPVDWPLLQFVRLRAGKILELRPFHWDTAKIIEQMKGPGERGTEA